MIVICIAVTCLPQSLLVYSTPEQSLSLQPKTVEVSRCDLEGGLCRCCWWIELAGEPASCGCPGWVGLRTRRLFWDGPECGW